MRFIIHGIFCACAYRLCEKTKSKVVPKKNARRGGHLVKLPTLYWLGLSRRFLYRTMSDHEGEGREEVTPLSRAEIQHLVSESIAAALRSRDDSATPQNPPPPNVAEAKARRQRHMSVSRESAIGIAGGECTSGTA